MSTRETAWPEGTPCWTDLTASERHEAWDFYSTLFGWKIEDSGEQYGHYGIARLNGLATAGLGEAMEGQDMPVAWVTYLATDDADRTAAAIAANAGTVVVPPMEIPDLGVMLLAQDPTGAFFGAWQAKPFVGCSLVNEPGGMVWNEHSSYDPATARAFYGAVFGHTYTAMEGMPDYTTIDGDGPGGTIGGLGAMQPGVPQGTPPHWLTYFAVQDADAAIATVTAGGGQAEAPAFDTPYGRMAVLSDPQGGVFAVMGIDPEATAQPS